MTKFALAAAAALLLTAAAAPGPVESGIQAWQAGRYDEAVRAWRPLADRGDPDALFNLGHAYRLGRGVGQDMAVAERHYERAARAGHVEAQAMYGLLLFQNGRRREAMPFVEQAAERGDARAQYVFGTALFNGDVVPRDWPRAYAFMTRAAAQGLPYAQSQLRQMDQHIPAPDRARGTQLAANMARTAPVPAPITERPAPAVTAAPTRPAPARPVPAPRPRPAEPNRAAPAAPAAVPAPSGRWKIQLGAFSSDANARKAWSQVSSRLPGLQPIYSRAGNLIRLQAGPLANRAAAQRACAALPGHCFPVAP